LDFYEYSEFCVAFMKYCRYLTTTTLVNIAAIIENEKWARKQNAEGE